MNKPIIALLYDFDKTLCTQDMQNYAFIPSLGMDPDAFWKEADGREKQCGVGGVQGQRQGAAERAAQTQIGRASCRERV